MNQERDKKNQSHPDQEKDQKMRQPYFDPSIPDAPLISDEDTAVNASNRSEE